METTEIRNNILEPRCSAENNDQIEFVHQCEDDKEE